MKLVVGLGNPGKKYEGTRHNVGFETVAWLAREESAAAARRQFDGETAECRLAGDKALLVAPQLYYNRSGETVRQAVNFFKVQLHDLLVVCDDFNLTVGQLRMRPSGTGGGNNGLADVIRQLGSNEFSRLRIGIGPLPQRWDPADFVLGRFSKDQRAEIDLQIARASDAVRLWAREGAEAAMNQYNGQQHSAD